MREENITPPGMEWVTEVYGGKEKPWSEKATTQNAEAVVVIPREQYQRIQALVYNLLQELTLLQEQHDGQSNDGVDSGG